MSFTIPSNMKKIAEVQHKVESKLLQTSNVVGVALGHKITKGIKLDQPSLSVLVSQKLPSSLLTKSEKIASRIDGVVTDVVEIGELFAGDQKTLSSNIDTNISTLSSFTPSLTKKIRPAMGGFSIGHYKVTAGTIGSCCYDLVALPSTPNKFYILSNNHILANSNMSKLGDPILQPSIADGGSLQRDVIARLARYIPIRFHSNKIIPINYIDAAIGEANLQDINREIYWSGYIRRLYEAPKIDDIVEKTGRTTGFTTGKVTNINATVDVNYGSGRVARFARQILTTSMSAPGDSGSIVLNRDEGAVGLLFAGSYTHSVINNILYVQSLLKIRLTEI
ncbi:hypothetical protein [Spartinivicinus poritis]|uniref:Nal1 N-terminal domain-containing protein n=1 Tax=Spartinivicinus poritis TaxID=2994640 RepID=A0ABT5UHI6_9GAMM|nr:hypothetical protein [Spartinivicinus sp. A2-2]MDE1465864.1 hypothetical protein [Spartinivicinus sp. A2-2]